MIRRGPKLHSLYPAKLEDHLLSDFGASDFDLCLQACALPRWFNFDILERALLEKLGRQKITACFKKILKEDYVKKYGDTGYFFSDPERYFFLNFAFQCDPDLGLAVWKNISQYFREMSNQLLEESDALRSRGYYDPLGVFEIEYLHLQLYDPNRDIQDTLKYAFSRFCAWRSDPSFNHRLNRRLVKALRDHLKTGVIEDSTSLAILNLMEYSTPPWSDRSAEKNNVLERSAPHLEGIDEVLPFYLLERAKSIAELRKSVEEERTSELFQRSRKLFQAAQSPYYVAETLRQEGKYLTLIDEFPEADKLLRSALAILEDTRGFPTQYSTTIYECWRLIAWNQFYRGGDGVEIARSIAEERYSELSQSGRRYMTSLFGILLAQLRATDSDFFEFGVLFFDTSEILDEAILNLVAIPDSIDYANALFQKITFDIEYLDSGVSSDEERTSITSQIADRLFETRTCYENMGSEQGLANVSYWEGRLSFIFGRYTASKESFELALKTYRSRADQFGQLNTLVRLGTVLVALKEYSDAIQLFSNAWNISVDRDWQDRYERNFFTAISKNPELEADLISADARARES